MPTIRVKVTMRLLKIIIIATLVIARSVNIVNVEAKNIIVEVKCYDKCTRECFREHLCSPASFLSHCADVCKLLCSYKVDAPTPPIFPA